MKFISFHAVTLVLSAAPLVGQEGSAQVRWEEYVGETPSGEALEGRLGRIRVPERRGAEGGGEIDLAFVVYPSTNPDPGPPIYFLVGGPGPSGVEFCAATAAEPLLPLLEHGDVVGIDQRGTGLTRPNLEEGPEFTYELPYDELVTRADHVAAWREAAARCHAHWTGQGIDLAAYNTAESADDVDDVRRALGHERIVLWGTSYGSHLGLAYLRRHAEHVERAVLMKVEGPDHTFKLPSTTQRVLERVSGLGTPLPDLVGTVRALLAQLEEEPVRLTTDRLGPAETTVVIGPDDLRRLVATALGGGTPSLAGLPMALDLMANGEWRHVLGFVARDRRGSVGSAMALMMDCSSGASAARLERIERERRDPANLLGDALSLPIFPEVCAGCGDPDLGDEYRGPLRCDVPVLFVSGDLDARTPPENVEEIRAGFSAGVHVLVRNTGHDSRELSSEDYRDLVRAFLAGEELEDMTIELPPFEFRPLRGR